MTTLPTGAQLIAAANVSAMQGLMSDQATAISEMPGGAVATTLTIAAGAVTPTVACHLVDTEAAAASDDLTNIVTTNHPDGRRLLISMVDAARIVTVKHNAGGAGQIALANSYDLVLKVGGWVELKRTGANWEEVARSQNLISTIQLSGAVNEAYVTVASHATTADIWGAKGNVINFTGTATVTAFPNAPQAGVRRRLICAGACSFTAGASMVIDGVASASTLTAAAGDVVDIESVSTTSFKLHHVPVGGVLPLAGGTMTGSLTLGGAGTGIIFEGATADAYETTLTAGDPTADRSIVLPNEDGTLLSSAIIDTDPTLAANSDVKIASQKAVKAYVTAQVAASSAPDLTSDVGQLYLAVARIDTPTSPNAGGTQVADEFDDSTGIGSLGSGTVASGYLSNSAGGYTSNLCSGGTALEDSHSSSLVAANAFDGDSGTYWQSNVTGAGANGVAYIGYSFATAEHIRQIVFTGYDGTYYVSSWLVQRKVSGTWTTVTTIAPAATSSAQTFAIPASDAQTDWRLLANATPSSTYVHCKEMQMMAANAASNITTVSNAYTALTAPSTVSFVVEHQDVSTTAAVNTDIIVSASRDSGTTWTAVTLTDFGPSPISGARVLKGSATVSGQPSGTAIKWKVETANAKEQRVHGLWMQWK